MSLKKHLIQEFECRVFEESYTRIYKCLTMLNEEQLWSSPNATIPSAGCQIMHLCGNARQWVLSGLGGAPDNRDRDQEFVVQENIRKSDFIFLLENLKSQLQRCFQELNDEDLETIHSIQGFNVTGFSAIAHVLEHFSYHSGQIALLTKFHTGKETGFYTEIDLNQHNNLN
ncbi:MAG: DinB family protein [Crocinitomicaceae bacterium]|nr:DinB family protein [Crocinitomicaceae bacterium]